MDRRLPAKKHADTAEKLRAVAEALLVLCCTLGLVGVVHNSALAHWQSRVTPWPWVENAAMLALPLLWLLLTGRKFSEYGLTTEGIRSPATTKGSAPGTSQPGGGTIESRAVYPGPLAHFKFDPIKRRSSCPWGPVVFRGTTTIIYV
jgi:hypothetical protein